MLIKRCVSGSKGPYWYQKKISFEITQSSDFLFVFVARQQTLGNGTLSIDKLELSAGLCHGEFYFITLFIYFALKGPIPSTKKLRIDQEPKSDNTWN